MKPRDWALRAWLILSRPFVKMSERLSSLRHGATRRSRRVKTSMSCARAAVIPECFFMYARRCERPELAILSAASLSMWTRKHLEYWAMSSCILMKYFSFFSLESGMLTRAKSGLSVNAAVLRGRGRRLHLCYGLP